MRYTLNQICGSKVVLAVTAVVYPVKLTIFISGISKILHGMVSCVRYECFWGLWLSPWVLNIMFLLLRFIRVVNLGNSVGPRSWSLEIHVV